MVMEVVIGQRNSPRENPEPLKSTEIEVVERYEGQVMHVRGRCDLAIGKWRRLSPFCKTGPFPGVPFRRDAIVVKDRHRGSDDIIEISGDGFAAAGRWKAFGAELQLVPDDGRDGNLVFVPDHFPKHASPRCRAKRLGNHIGIQQIL
jgi:hypothetical protein